ncbi:MAG: MGMT family protein [Candidatus Aenigmatarchaeota archaeon]
MNPKSKQLYRLLQKISKGKLTTYGILAQKLRTNPRAVGRLLNKNPHPGKYPCYKVVLSSGKICGYSSGIRKKISLLEKEGIFVKNGKIVDFHRIIFRFR